MGRRGAPQPLRLSDPTGAVPGGTTTTTTTLTTLTTSPDGNNLISASSSSRAPVDRHRPSPTSNTANSPATAHSAGISPIDSRSPRSSPRVSPFTSRFSTRRPHTSRATSDERSHTLHSDEHTPPLPEARPDPSWQSISSAADAQQPSKDPVTTSRQPQDGATKLQKSATEHSKKFSRAGFFHFAKSSKASNSLHASGSSSLSVGRNQNISRGRDSPETTSQTGMSCFLFLSDALVQRGTRLWYRSCLARATNLSAKVQCFGPGHSFKDLSTAHGSLLCKLC